MGYRQTDTNLRQIRFLAFSSGIVQQYLSPISPSEGQACPACKPSIHEPCGSKAGFTMSITSELICQAADQLKGFVGFNHKAAQYIVRFSEDAFGMDVADDAIFAACEFVWVPAGEEAMSLSRERIQLLLDQNIDDRINISEPLRVYQRRVDIPEIVALRRALIAS